MPGREIVGGDIVLLEAGNFVAADVRLVESFNLKVDEASLTGESLPVEKDHAVVLDPEVPLGDRRNTAFMGTLVSYGRGKGLVTSTGMNTQIGLIAQMIQSFEDEATPLQKKLEHWARCSARPAWRSASSCSSTACSATRHSPRCRTSAWSVIWRPSAATSSICS